MFENLLETAASPNAPALRLGANRVYSYAQMAADIRRCVAWLSRQKIGSSSRAVLHALDPHMYWVLFFALETRGVATIGMPATDGVDEQFAGYVGADLVFSSQPDPKLPGIDWVRADTGFRTIIRGFRPQPLPPRKRQPSDPICIVLSTGTTGLYKKVLLTRELLDRRIRREGSVGTGARLACLLPYTSIGGIQCALRAWLGGGTLIIPGQHFAWPAELASGNITLVKGVPSHFDSLLGQLPAEMPRPQALLLDCGGGTLSPGLRDRLRERLSDEIRVAYGSTETGSIARANIDVVGSAAEVVGSVLPWMRVEVIGEDGSALPRGETGEIRIAGEDIVDGYFESPEDTARHFRAGWFHPGDVGYIDDDGNLVVTGRIDDLMNLGGAKILPSRAEAIVLNIPGIEDAAAFAVADEHDQPTLWIAYCAPAPVDAELIRTALLAFPRIQPIRLPSIPRNPMGRIERAALRDKAERGLLAGLAP